MAWWCVDSNLVPPGKRRVVGNGGAELIGGRVAEVQLVAFRHGQSLPGWFVVKKWTWEASEVPLES